MAGKTFKILVLNLGSTSTKVAVYENDKLVCGESISHPTSDLERYPSVFDQYEYRLAAVNGFMQKHGYDYGDLDIMAARGGNVKPVPGGIYLLNEEMIADMYTGKYGVHPNCNGNKIIYEMGRKHGIPAIFVDPPVTDEFDDVARMTGLPEVTRQSSGHALNQKATARKIATELGTTYDKVNLIVCHLGGGISVGAHRKGRIVDMNNALDGSGPMAPERAGSLPTGSLVDMCYSGAFTHGEMRKKLTGKGGWVAHLGSADGRELENRVNAGDPVATAVFNATIYQLGKEIGAMATVLEGDLDGIGFTGSLAHAAIIIEAIKKRTAFLKAPFFVYPGENEMEALCSGALRYLRGEEAAAPY